MVLCFMVFCSVLFSFVATSSAEDADQAETIDYILILDCTVRAVQADQDGIRKAAAKMFVDLLPVDNARVAVFTIGDRDENAQHGRPDLAKSYQLRKDDDHVANALYRMQCIYQLWDFDQPISTISQREELKAIIDKAYVQTKGGFSDTHCAAYAAIDTLKYWNSKNACILLVSEEFTASYNEHLIIDANGNQINSDHTMWDDVESALDANDGWTLNWVDLGNGTPKIRERIEFICKKYNRGETCYDFSISQLPQMIASVVSKYTGSSEKDAVIKKLDSSGVVNIELPDFVMLTEANVVVTGDGVENVTVTDAKGSKIEKPRDDIWFSMNYDPQERSHFLYSAVKMIRPTSGSWTVSVKGQPGTQVYVQAIHTLEPDILLTRNYPEQGGMLGVGTTLQFTATYQYAGEDLHCGNDAYKHYLDGARLYYTHSSNPNKKVDISQNLRVESEQYVADFKLQDRGTYSFYFYVESNDFKSGIRKSNALENITVENHAPKPVGSVQDLNDVVVGSHLEGVFNIAELFKDEDKEQLIYHVECRLNGRVEGLDFDIASDGFISFVAPVKDGRYDVLVYAEDTNQAQSEPVAFAMNVVNRAPELKKKSPLRVWMIVNAPDSLRSLGLLPKDENAVYDLNLNDVFCDPDNLPLRFTLGATDIAETEGEELISTQLDSITGELHLQANKSGKATIEVHAIDSAEATETIVLKINIRTVGQVLIARYWWVLVIIALIIIIALILVISRRVALRWSVQIKRNNVDIEQSFRSLPAADKKFKKTSVDLMDIIDKVFDRNDMASFIDIGNKVIVFKGVLPMIKKVPFIYDANNGDGLNAKIRTKRLDEDTPFDELPDLPTKGTLYSGDTIILNIAGSIITIEVA